MMNGIDIASYQAGINIQQVKPDFVIIKATEGTNYVNPACNDQYDSAVKAGAKIGLYHFATLNTSPEEQAHFFVANVKNYLLEGHALAALDWEADAITLGPEWAKRYLDTVYELISATPIIYMSKSVTNAFDWSAVAQHYALWGAQYADMNDVTEFQKDPWTDNLPWGAWVTPTIFQYSSSGRLPGWNGYLDLNKAYITQQDWDKFTTKNS
ncbi:GH25 family lysozyme [Furfurilactobacillus entadae]|uniref:GH25 family lysozyme n=1 Tax=Furfurilactobacillus entadae TaxID=2922307 RepID=UPI0035E58BC9